MSLNAIKAHRLAILGISDSVVTEKGCSQPFYYVRFLYVIIDMFGGILMGILDKLFNSDKKILNDIEKSVKPVESLS